MPEESLIEEMRAAVRGDRERARQRQLASGSSEPVSSHAAAPPEDERPAPEPAPERRWWQRLRRRSPS